MDTEQGKAYVKYLRQATFENLESFLSTGVTGEDLAENGIKIDKCAGIDFIEGKLVTGFSILNQFPFLIDHLTRKAHEDIAKLLFLQDSALAYKPTGVHHNRRLRQEIDDELIKRRFLTGNYVYGFKGELMQNLIERDFRRLPFIKDIEYPGIVEWVKQFKPSISYLDYLIRIEDELMQDKYPQEYKSFMKQLYGYLKSVEVEKIVDIISDKRNNGSRTTIEQRRIEYKYPEPEEYFSRGVAGGRR